MRLTPHIEVLGLQSRSPKLRIGVLCPLCGEKVIERTIDVSKIPLQEVEDTMALASIEDSGSYFDHLKTHGVHVRGELAG